MLKQISKTYCCIGLMSGTSLDGLDIALCNLSIKDGKWSYSFIKTATVEYAEHWKKRLRNNGYIGGYELIQLHREYGLWLADQLKYFLKGVEQRPDFIASHGHTYYHEPAKKINLQIGDGAVIAASLGIPTVSDFRSLDICLGGQGAPLVPIGDHMLFSDYSACVNLGGFANVSCVKDGRRVAWDICPVNFVCNRLVQALDLEYDEGGQLGREGKIIGPLLNQLNQLEYYGLSHPKSLGQEWVEVEMDPLLENFNNEAVSDVLRTYYEHVADVLARDLSGIKGSILFTGGGVYNCFLMERIEDKLGASVYIPDQQLVDYKEALVFALLGAMRLRGENNCLASVTGACRDNSSGIIHCV